MSATPCNSQTQTIQSCQRQMMSHSYHVCECINPQMQQSSSPHAAPTPTPATLPRGQRRTLRNDDTIILQPKMAESLPPAAALACLLRLGHCAPSRPKAALPETGPTPDILPLPNGDAVRRLFRFQRITGCSRTRRRRRSAGRGPRTSSSGPRTRRRTW